MPYQIPVIATSLTSNNTVHSASLTLGLETCTNEGKWVGCYLTTSGRECTTGSDDKDGGVGVLIVMLHVCLLKSLIYC